MLEFNVPSGYNPSEDSSNRRREVPRPNLNLSQHDSSFENLQYSTTKIDPEFAFPPEYVPTVAEELEAEPVVKPQTNPVPRTSSHYPSPKIGSEFLLFVKRLLDLTASILGLVLFSPVMLICAVLIKLDSVGPVFYRQERVGINRRRNGRRSEANEFARDRRKSRNRRREDYFGQPFTLYKFRTLRVETEKNGTNIIAENLTLFCTRFGRLLRRSRLAELPQLWNILKGEMSLVGPKPEKATQIIDASAHIDNYYFRQAVKPGLTGLAQIEVGIENFAARPDQRLNYDLYYAVNWSLWQDAKILLKALGQIADAKSAF
ncbi:MAG: sugar transferase [candidate division Zixibacteria bacterium]|nr:sugar transferase [candidate division Zixibacteria bacterium]